MPDDVLEPRLLSLLSGRGARVPFVDATAGVPPDLQGRRPEGLPYAPWELVEHLRLAQHDILDYCRPGPYEQPEWPAGYWPPTPAPPSADAWDESRARFADDREALRALVREAADLHAPVPHAQKKAHTFVRQVLLVADHTSYHVGQVVVARRLLDCWEAS